MNNEDVKAYNEYVAHALEANSASLVCNDITERRLSFIRSVRNIYGNCRKKILSNVVVG